MMHIAAPVLARLLGKANHHACALIFRLADDCHGISQHALIEPR